MTHVRLGIPTTHSSFKNYFCSQIDYKIILDIDATNCF